MKKTLLQFKTIAVLFTFAFCSQTFAGTNTWSGASGVNLNWSNQTNWISNSAPGANDEARFLNGGATNDGVTTTETVTTNTTVNRVWVGSTNLSHNILINPGVTLTVAGTNDNGFGPL